MTDASIGIFLILFFGGMLIAGLTVVGGYDMWTNFITALKICLAFVGFTFICAVIAYLTGGM